MGYRDEMETLRARVSQLETELSEANDTIERLTGAAPTGPVTVGTDDVIPSRVLDGPGKITLSRELDLEVDDEGLEAIAAHLTMRYGVQVRQIGRSLQAPGFSVTQRDGKTRITTTNDYGALSAASITLSGLLGGFLTLMTFAVGHDLFARGLAEWHIAWLAPLVMALVFVVARRLTSRVARNEATKRRATFEALVEIAKRHGHAATPKARVEVEAEAEGDEVEVEPPPEAAKRAR
ncbi:MAG: hypothetical protein H6719_14615 [Sandaracinaceae bacterium]|nr:hypothetical protein [Sandaracinaceae bacterium]